MLKSPYPWFGGKSRVAHLVWDRFGDVPNYVEPFFGSGAVLLARPHIPRNETVNDKDAYLANFWLALKYDPEGVARWADDPVNETMLHSRHKWLVREGITLQQRMDADPMYYDVQVAGWWVWGVSQWIGSGWCAHPEWTGRTNAGRVARGIHGETERTRPHLQRGGQGVTAVSLQIPYLVRSQGIHRPLQKRPLLPKGGHGVHRASEQLPYLDKGGKGVHQNSIAEKMPGVGCSLGHLQGEETQSGLYAYFDALAARLRRVRVCCGDWERILGPSPTTKIGLTGVFLDPPYDMRVVQDKPGSDGNARTDVLYNQHDNDLSRRVAQWAIEHGSDPLLRIAVCGYEGEHTFPEGWECIAWKANGGYANQAGETPGKVNAGRERIWFSPNCIRPTLFAFDHEAQMIY